MNRRHRLPPAFQWCLRKCHPFRLPLLQAIYAGKVLKDQNAVLSDFVVPVSMPAQVRPLQSPLAHPRCR